MMCDELEILNREIERLLQSSTMEGSSLSTESLQPPTSDSREVATASGSDAQGSLVKVSNTLMLQGFQDQLLSLLFGFIYVECPPPAGGMSTCIIYMMGWMLILPYKLTQFWQLVSYLSSETDLKMVYSNFFPLSHQLISKMHLN